eukprot:13920390-Ditylum_brightwellii.AAC.1
MKIAQLLIQPCCTPTLVPAQNRDITERNNNGFGSTEEKSRKDTSHLQRDYTSQLLPTIEDVEEGDEDDGYEEVHQTPSTPHKKKEQSETPIENEEEHDGTATEDETTCSITSAALEEEDWENNWMDYETLPTEGTEFNKTTNMKTHSSIPVETRAHEIEEQQKADTFWQA